MENPDHEKEFLIREMERLYERGFQDGMAYAKQPTGSAIETTKGQEYGSMLQRQSHDAIRYYIDRLLNLQVERAMKEGPAKPIDDQDIDPENVGFKEIRHKGMKMGVDMGYGSDRTETIYIVEDEAQLQEMKALHPDKNFFIERPMDAKKISSEMMQFESDKYRDFSDEASKDDNHS